MKSSAAARSARTQVRMQYLEGDGARIVGVDLFKSRQRLFAVNLGRMSECACLHRSHPGGSSTNLDLQLPQGMLKAFEIDRVLKVAARNRYGQV